MLNPNLTLFVHNFLSRTSFKIKLATLGKMLKGTVSPDMCASLAP